MNAERIKDHFHNAQVSFEKENYSTSKEYLEKILKIDICLHKPMQKRKKILFKLLNKCYPTVQPEKIKKGFSISLTNWIKEDYQKPFKDKLLDPTFCDTMGLNRPAIEQMLSKHILDRKDYKWPLFSLYSLSVWNKYEREFV